LKGLKRLVDDFASRNGYGRVRITSGIREIPAQNMAAADVYVETYRTPNGQRHDDTPGTIAFSKYDDGRWFLTQFSCRLPHYWLNDENKVAAWTYPSLSISFEVP
jgi:hypothetical protein